MAIENRYNLIEEAWIPIVNIGYVSLREVFSQPSYRQLGGNPIQKIALSKLLLAIAQAAATPTDDQDWLTMGANGMASRCLAYLEQWQSRFYLYGEHAFLQMQSISRANIQSFGSVMPEIATGNTTVLTQTHIERPLADAEKALLIVTLMGFGLGGKKTDNSIVLSEAYTGKSNDNNKPATGKPGPNLGFMGYLHHFVTGPSLLETLWLNLFSQQAIADLGYYPDGIGLAPWEAMPIGENCKRARGLQHSLMGRLVPLSRFCLLTDAGLHYSEGIAHLGYKDGYADPSVAIIQTAAEPRALWSDPDKRPWRNLTALLSFLASNPSTSVNCPQLQMSLTRAKNHAIPLGIWSGGIRVSSNAGEQYLSGNDDFVEGYSALPANQLNPDWYEQLAAETSELEQLAKIVYSTTLSFCKNHRNESKVTAMAAETLFWQLCATHFQHLLLHCDQTEARFACRQRFADLALQAYDYYCHQQSARQLDAWARNRPNLSKYRQQPAILASAQPNSAPSLSELASSNPRQLALLKRFLSSFATDTSSPLGLGRAIALCYEGGSNNEQAQMRLRHLLDCENLDEVFHLCPSLIKIITNKTHIVLNHNLFLQDLVKFDQNADAIKKRWAQEFYSRTAPKEAA